MRTSSDVKPTVLTTPLPGSVYTGSGTRHPPPWVACLKSRRSRDEPRGGGEGSGWSGGDSQQPELSAPSSSHEFYLLVS